MPRCPYPSSGAGDAVSLISRAANPEIGRRRGEAGARSCGEPAECSGGSRALVAISLERSRRSAPELRRWAGDCGLQRFRCHERDQPLKLKDRMDRRFMRRFQGLA